MKRKLIKAIAILLTNIFLLQTSVFAISAISYDEDFGLNNSTYVTYESNINPIDIFNVQPTPGRAHAGYIFQLVEGAVIPEGEHKGVRLIHTNLNMFVARNLEDIINFIDPEFIMYIEPDYFRQIEPMHTIPAEVPTFAPHAFAPGHDPLYYRQWNLEFIRGAAAWSTTPAVSTDGIIVAVIDSGIYENHRDFDGTTILTGRNFMVRDENYLSCLPSPCHICDTCGLCHFCGEHNFREADDLTDESGHGTSVTGLITTTKNDFGIASMTREVFILPLRAFVKPCGHSRVSAIVAAIDYATSRGVHIINLSFGGLGRIETEARAINDAVSRDIWVIAGVGNSGHIGDGTAMHYPAGLDNVVGVGAITRHGERWFGSQQNSSVFVVAPGEDVLTTTIGNGHVYAYGTSMAVPHISSLAAIARAYSRDNNLNMTQNQFRNLLRNSAIPRGYPTHNANGWRVPNHQYGYGIVDVGLFMYNLTRRDFFTFNDLIGGGYVSQGARSDIIETARWGIMHGRIRDYTSNRTVNLGSQHSFWPHEAMWRLEFPMALGRLYELSGRNIHWVNSTFSDANTQALFPYNYSRYVRWAAENNIVSGVGGNQFNPGGDVTRESAAVMFYRFTRLLAQNCHVANSNINSYINWIENDPRGFLREIFPNDYHLVSDWAVNEMAWAVASGIIEGRRISGRFYLAPGESITRAEGAVLMARYRRRFTQNTLWNLAGEANNWSHLILNFGATTHSVNIPFNDNIAHFLSWFRGGEFANHEWFLDSNFNTRLTGTLTASSTPLTLFARLGNHPIIRRPFGSPNANINRWRPGSPPYLERDYDATGRTRPFIDPIVLDLTGNGLETVGLEAGVYFDMDNDGFATRTGWITPNNGFLVLDRTGSGTIDSGRELFGDQTLLKDGVTLADNGFQALAEFDIDGRGVIDASTPIFPYLRVWVDKNMDGITDPGELYTLPELGIEAISLIYISAFSTDNILMRRSFMRMDDGTFRDVGEFLFVNNPFLSFERIYTPRTPEIMALPNIYETGRLFSLHTAMVRDPVLQQMVEEYVNEPSLDARRAMVRPIIFRWAGVEDIVANSRGRFVDARQLAVLELIFARAFVGLENTGNPNNRAGPELAVIFSRFEGYVFTNLEMQSWLSTWLSYLPDIDLMFDRLDNALVQYSEVAAVSMLRSLEKLFAETNANHRIALISRFADIFRELGIAGIIIGTDGDDEIRTPSNLGHTIFGLGGNDTITLTGGNNRIYPGPGNNIINGSTTLGIDTIVIGRGHGLNTVAGNSHAASAVATALILRDGITPDEVFFRRVGDNMEVIIINDGLATNISERDRNEALSNASNRIVFVNYFSLARHQITGITFDDGTVLTRTEISNLNRRIYGTDGDDEIRTPDNLGYIIFGLGGNDTITLTGGNNRIYPGPGNNIINGSTTLGIDTIVIGRGHGLNTVAGNSHAASAVATALILKDGITPDEVFFRRVGDNMEVIIINDGLAANISERDRNEALNDASNRIVFVNYFSLARHQITGITFDDGTVLTRTEISNLNRRIYGTDGDDELRTPDNLGYTIFGFGGNDTITLTGGNNRIYPGPGNNIINGSTTLGIDTIVIGRGHGLNTVAGNSHAASVVATALVLRDGITQDEVFFRRVGDNMEVIIIDGGLGANISERNRNEALANASNRIVLVNYFNAARNQITGITFDDGEVITREEISNQSRRIYGTDGDDEIRTPDNLGHTIFGFGGNDTITLTGGNNRIYPGPGNNIINGSTTLGIDTIVIGRGHGQNTVAGNSHAASVVATALVLRDGITQDEVFFRRVGDNMEVIIINDGLATNISERDRNEALSNASNRIVFVNYFSLARHQITGITFDDGTILTRTEISNLNRRIYGTDGDDEISTPDNLGHYVFGFGGNDTITLTGGNNRIYPGPGNNMIYGSTTLGIDTIVIGRGHGLNTVAGNSHAASVVATALVLRGGITQDEVFFRRVGDNMEVIIIDGGFAANISERDRNEALANASNRIVFVNYFNLARHQITGITLDDGTVLTRTEISNLNRRIYGTDGDDEISTPDNLGHYVFGFGGNDTITLTGGNNRIYPGPGNNIINGSSTSGIDTIVIGRGHELNTVLGNSHAASVVATALILRDGITQDEVFFRRVGDNMEVIIIDGGLGANISEWERSEALDNASNRIVFVNYFAAARHQITGVIFDDGTVLLRQDLLNIVNALPQAATFGFEAAIVSLVEIEIDKYGIDDYYDYELRERPSDYLYFIEYSGDIPE